MAASIHERLSIEDSSYSQISCGPRSIAAKLLVGIVDVGSAKGPTTYTLRAQLADSGLEWTVQRRYSEFLQLREDLMEFFAHCMVQQCFGCRWFCQSLHGFAFPRRRLLSSRCADVVQIRRSELDQFARLLASHAFSAIPKCVTCSKLPFARVRDFFIKDAKFSPQQSHDALFHALRVENFSAIADPKKSKIEFRRGHAIHRMLQLEKTVHSKRAHHEQAFLDEVRRDQLQSGLRRRRSSFIGDIGRDRSASSVGGGDSATLDAFIDELETEVGGGKEEEDVRSSRSEDGGDQEFDMTVVEIDMSRAPSTRRLAPLREALASITVSSA